MRNSCKNSSCIKEPVNKNKLFMVSGFTEELKKQIPGLKLDQSHIYKTVNIIEKILDKVSY